MPSLEEMLTKKYINTLEQNVNQYLDENKYKEVKAAVVELPSPCPSPCPQVLVLVLVRVRREHQMKTGLRRSWGVLFLKSILIHFITRVIITRTGKINLTLKVKCKSAQLKTSALNQDQFKRFIATCVNVSHKKLSLWEITWRRSRGGLYLSVATAIIVGV